MHKYVHLFCSAKSNLFCFNFELLCSNSVVILLLQDCSLLFMRYFDYLESSKSLMCLLDVVGLVIKFLLRILAWLMGFSKIFGF